METAGHPKRIAVSARTRTGRGLAAPVAFAALVCGSAEVSSQTRERLVVEPPRATKQIVRPRTPATLETVAPAAAASATMPVSGGGEAVFDLNIVFTDATIYNAGTNQYDRVRLRSYRDAHGSAPAVPFVAPTIEIFPGETVRVGLNNVLPAEPDCAKPDINTPNCFNRTNLHSHGLWISPAGNGDNVLLSINPGVRFQYEYNVPPDHPAGTFWYHPHRHGSTALQVSSGMAGVLIVKGTRPPGPGATGDIDTLLRDATGAPFQERLVLLQQIQYACRDAAGNIKVRKDGNNVVAWVCDPGDVGEISGYDQFGPGSWQESARYTSINGEVLPTFARAKAGRIERWRVVHAGVRDTVQLQFKKMRPGAEPYALLAAPQQEEWLSRNCPGPELLPQFALASDGLTRSRLTERTTSTLQPGYREDLLVVFPEAGDYCVLDADAPAISTVNSQANSRQFLGRVTVEPGTTIADPRAHVQAELVAAADRFMPASVRQKVRDDLANGLRLASFVPHPDIADNEVKGTQSLQFKINLSGGPVFQVDGRPYDPDRIDRTLTLGGVDEWTLTSYTDPPVGHPFHIHVNPFQVVKILTPNGTDVSVDGEPDDKQYADLKGAWRDTLFVKPGYQVVMRTRYQRYVGDYVLHCHILDHEDQGMMQNIRIALPDGMGGIARAHGH